MRSLTLPLAGLCAILAGCASDPCSSYKGACISALVQGSVGSLDELAVTLQGRTTPMTSRPGAIFSLPVKIAIGLPATTMGTVVVTLQGLLNGNVTATSSGNTITIPPSHRASAVFTLRPFARTGDGGNPDLGDGGESNMDLAPVMDLGSPVLDLSGPIVSMSPSSASWSGVARASTATKVETFTVTNRLSTSETIASVGFGGSNAAEFSVQAGSTCAAQLVLTPTATCTVSVVFSPSFTGAHSASVNVLFGDSTAVTSTLTAQSIRAWSMETQASLSALSAFWGSTATDVYALGTVSGGGSTTPVLHSTGTGTWSTSGSITGMTGSSAWGTSANDVYVASDGGVFHSTDGSTWAAVPTAVSHPVTIIGDAAGDIYLGGRDSGFNSVLYHRAPGAAGVWNSETPSGLGVLTCIAPRTASSAFLLDSAGHLWASALPSSAGSWMSQTAFTTNDFLSSCWAAPNGDVFVTTGGHVWHYHQTWTDETVSQASGTASNQVSGALDGLGGFDVYTVGGDANVYHSKGDGTWDSQATPLAKNNVVWVAPNGDIFIGGAQIAHYY